MILDLLMWIRNFAIRKFAKFRTFLISRNFANNFHFYFAKFRKQFPFLFSEILRKTVAKFCEINWKFREIRNEFLVRNFAKFRIHPTIPIVFIGVGERVNAISQDLLRQYWSPGSRGHILLAEEVKAFTVHWKKKQLSLWLVVPPFL